MGGDPSAVDPEKLQDDVSFSLANVVLAFINMTSLIFIYFTQFNDFYEEIYEELKQFGTIEDIQVCENLGDHMVGNVYVKFEDEEEAEGALSNLNGRFYAGRMLTCEYSPVTDFREARCRQYDEGTCGRGGFCNFMHVREPSRELRKHLERVCIVYRVHQSKYTL